MFFIFHIISALFLGGGAGSLVLEGFVSVAVGLVEFRLELYPMETERMQEALQDIHTQQDRGGNCPPDTAGEVHRDGTGDGAHVGADATQNLFYTKKTT